ncbi:hypothetical protein GCM10010267_04380 [Streptomyces griseorubens]|uniref:hypothetical protein n=1 Tax=Streptomyces griseorubens TaxID=66897 RepID=UPI001787222F|nr:hypothetical protein GCM10010267_04380 [Streptomyces griseorubens]
MSVTARRIASVPYRTSSQTWQAIVDLLAPEGSPARSTLLSAGGPSAVIIAEEYTSGAPIVVLPVTGPRIRIRTVHGADAFDAAEDETPLMSRPLDQPGWTLSLPCAADDLDELRAALAGHSQITVRSLDDDVDDTASAQAHGVRIVINTAELEAP